MLKRTPSLKVRAAVIFATIYLVIQAAGFYFFHSDSLSTERERPHAGPEAALGFAGRDLRPTKDGFVMSDDGDFARLASKNPQLWLLVEDDERRLEIGTVPASARRLADSDLAAVRRARFKVSEAVYPLSEAVLARRRGALFLVGGVDPTTVTPADSFKFYRNNPLFLMLLVLGGVGLAAILIAAPLLTAALKPATRQLALIEADRPDHRIQEKVVPSEVLPLVRGINHALDRLAEELERRRRFIADAAHELKTPLAILILQVDALKSSDEKRDMRRTVNRLSALVSQMLDVQRLSLGGRQRSEVDLATLAAEVTADMAPLALASGYDLSLDAPPEPVLIHGDAPALGRALANLIGNAIAHAGEKGEIRVVVREDRTIDVIDHGPGVSPAIRKDLFEPFVRGRWDRDGCGLGLHLTREIMRAHGGDVSLLETEAGATFRLSFS